MAKSNSPPVRSTRFSRRTRDSGPPSPALRSGRNTRPGYCRPVTSLSTPREDRIRGRLGPDLDHHRGGVRRASGPGAVRGARRGRDGPGAGRVAPPSRGQHRGQRHRVGLLEIPAASREPRGPAGLRQGPVGVQPGASVILAVSGRGVLRRQHGVLEVVETAASTTGPSWPVTRWRRRLARVWRSRRQEYSASEVRLRVVAMAEPRVEDLVLVEVRKRIRDLLAVRLGRELASDEQALWDRLVARERALTGAEQPGEAGPLNVGRCRYRPTTS